MGRSGAEALSLRCSSPRVPFSRTFHRLVPTFDSWCWYSLLFFVLFSSLFEEFFSPSISLFLSIFLGLPHFLPLFYEPVSLPRLVRFPLPLYISRFQYWLIDCFILFICYSFHLDSFFIFISVHFCSLVLFCLGNLDNRLATFPCWVFHVKHSSRAEFLRTVSQV